MAVGGKQASVEPVFLRQRDLPVRPFTVNATDDRFSALNICLAAEKTAGKETVYGIQALKGVWRIYPQSRKARDALLLGGIEMGGQSFTLHDRNPYHLTDNFGEEVPTTKLWISDLTISVDENDIESALVRIGCVLRSKIVMEKLRNKDGALTRFVSGRRFVFINLPPKPLDRELKVGSFTGKLFYREMPRPTPRPVTCSRCLQSGHHVSVCQNLVTCRACRLSGHTRGDPVCNAVFGGSQWDLPGDVISRATTVLDRDEAETQAKKTGERKEEREEEDNWQDTSSDLPTLNTNSAKSYSTPKMTERGTKKPAERPTSEATASSKRLRSPAGDLDLPVSLGATPKQQRLTQDTGDAPALSDT